MHLDQSSPYLIAYSRYVITYGTLQPSFIPPSALFRPPCHVVNRKACMEDSTLAYCSKHVPSTFQHVFIWSGILAPCLNPWPRQPQYPPLRLVLHTSRGEDVDAHPAMLLGALSGSLVGDGRADVAVPVGCVLSSLQLPLSTWKSSWRPIQAARLWNVGDQLSSFGGRPTALMA